MSAIETWRVFFHQSGKAKLFLFRQHHQTSLLTLQWHSRSAEAVYWQELASIMRYECLWSSTHLTPLFGVQGRSISAEPTFWQERASIMLDEQYLWDAAVGTHLPTGHSSAAPARWAMESRLAKQCRADAEVDLCL